MASLNEVRKWASDAFSTLERASQISSSAQAIITSTESIFVEELPKKVEQAISAHDTATSAQAQLATVTKNLQASVLQTTDSFDTQVEQILQPALADLEDVLRELHQTEVPGYIVIPEAGVQPKTSYRLDEFISLEEIELLRANIAVYTGNCDKVNTALRRLLRELLAESRSKLVELKKSSSAFDEQVFSVKFLLKHARGAGDFIGTMLRENDSLGSELSSLLEMLTNHLDQCTLAVGWMEAESGSESVDTQVLRNDSRELPSVLKEVRTIHDIISNNEKRAVVFAESKAAELDMLTAACLAWSRWHAHFEASSVAKLLVLLVQARRVHDYCTVPAPKFESDDLASPVERYGQVVGELCNHYRQFCRIYHAHYLSELHYEQFVYPRKVLKTLDDFLNGSLLAMDDEERQRRREWLRRYGDYIPGSFKLPGESQPHVVQVVSKGFDHLNEPAAHSDEERLVEVMRAAQAEQALR